MVGEEVGEEDEEAKEVVSSSQRHQGQIVVLELNPWHRTGEVGRNNNVEAMD